MGTVLPEHTTAVSLLDRLIHHSVVLVTDGDSYPMREARQQEEPDCQREVTTVLTPKREWGLLPGQTGDRYLAIVTSVNDGALLTPWRRSLLTPSWGGSCGVVVGHLPMSRGL